jgi:predicted enzyme related to lactoylglutathione lyase
MGEQDRYIPGVPCWVDTTQPDPEAAVAFYGGLFGWQFEEVTPAGAPERYFTARLGGGDVAAVGSLPQGAPAEAAWNTYVWVADADATAAKVYEARGTVLVPPADVGDAGRMAVFADPDGAAFSVWQPRRHRGATVVNEHGSLIFNNLLTRDLAAAERFYGAVFGWELLPVGSWSAWALPGYGDFLEARTPGMREGMAQMGAPERFEDVVASVEAGAGEPARWGVVFGVDDADAIAARAEELGGSVVVAPFDAPWVRSTVITDPQGATFVGNQFKPENRDLEVGAGAAA